MTMRVESSRSSALGDDRLRAVVERAGGFVEEQDPRLVDDRAGDHQPLPLAARQRAAAFGHVGVHAHRHLRMSSARPACSAASHASSMRARRDADDVAVDLRRQHAAHLQHHAHLLAHQARRRAARGPGRRTTPSRCVGCSKPSISRSSVDLPQPDGPTNATNSPGCDLERQVLQDPRPVGPIAEMTRRCSSISAAQPAG